MSCFGDHGLSPDQELTPEDGIILYDSYDVRHYAQFAKIYEPITRRLLGTAMVDDGRVFGYMPGVRKAFRTPEIPFELGVKPKLCAILDITDLDGLYYSTKPLLDAFVTSMELDGLYYEASAA